MAAQITTNLRLTSNTSNLFTTVGDYYVSGSGSYALPLQTIGITPGYFPASGTFDPLGDPLNRTPRPETPEEWLRRRVRETC